MILNNNNNNYSSFWMSDNDSDYEELFGIEEKKGRDLVQLASYKRAIGNFVNIVTGDSIPVTFTQRGDSYTDGKSVTIGANLTDKSFDIAVGLALHEGSHIKLSDFGFLKNLEVNIPSEVFVLAEKKGFDKYTTLGHIKNLLNYVEDRRIDYYIFKTSPGYKGYYHSMYDKYFNNKVIDRMLLSKEMREESWESYEARIINLHNKNRQLGALRGLRDIWSAVGLGSIGRLKSSEDAYRVAEDVYRIILSNLSDATLDNDSEESQNKGQGQGSDDSSDNTMSDEDFQDLLDSVENGEMESSSDGSSSGGSSIELPQVPSTPETPSENLDNDDGSESIELSERQKNLLKKALEKQTQFMNEDVQKTKLSKKEFNDVKAIEESGASYQEVGVDTEWGGKQKTRCLVVKKLTQSIIDSDQFRCATKWNQRSYGDKDSYRSSSYNFVEEGIRIGTMLGRKLQVRNEENSTKYTRKNSGKLDRRLIAELGFGNENVFSQTFVDKFSKVFVHLSIDASGSMSGQKWNKAMTSAVAMIKAADMCGNIDVVVTIRTTHASSHNRSTDVPLIMVCYDSRTDKLTKVRSLFGALDVSGTTPEGLCFESIMDDLIPGTTEQDSYFINYSDGQPYYGNKEIHYSGHTAEVHTKKMVNQMRAKGIKVLSYFIGGDYSYDSDNKAFTNMYGADSEFVNVTNVVDVARTMNKRFLTK
jgi:hypothetical protein